MRFVFLFTAKIIFPSSLDDFNHDVQSQQVSVFGYGADKQGNWHHYWENNRYAGAFRKTGVHNADFETEIIHRLSAESKIKLYR